MTTVRCTNDHEVKANHLFCPHCGVVTKPTAPPTASKDTTTESLSADDGNDPDVSDRAHARGTSGQNADSEPQKADAAAEVLAPTSAQASAAPAGLSALTTQQRTWFIVAALGLLLVVVCAFAIGRAGTEETFQDRVARLAAEERNVSGDYVPPTPESLVAYLREEEEVNVPNPANTSMYRYNALPDLPANDLFGNPTDSNPRHWFSVQFCAGGGYYEWDVNPYTETAYQDSLTIGGC